MGGFVISAERKQLLERNHLRVAKVRQPFEIENDHLADLLTALAHLEILVELLLVLDKKETRTTVAEDIFDLLGGVGRIDAVGDAADAHDAHVGIEPFRYCLGEDRNHLAALQPETDQAEPGPL